MNTEYKILPFFFMVLLFAAIGLGVQYNRFLIYLKANHFEKWKEFGSQTLFAGNSARTCVFR